MPDDHSKLVPPLPIPNRTVKQLSADDSAGSRVKVGHRQAVISATPPVLHEAGGFVFIAPCAYMAKTTAQESAKKLVKSAFIAMVFVFWMALLFILYPVLSARKSSTPDRS